MLGVMIVTEWVKGFGSIPTGKPVVPIQPKLTEFWSETFDDHYSRIKVRYLYKFYKFSHNPLYLSQILPRSMLKYCVNAK